MNIEDRSDYELWIRIGIYDNYWFDEAQTKRASRDFIDNYCAEDGITPSEWRYSDFNPTYKSDIYTKSRYKINITTLIPAMATFNDSDGCFFERGNFGDKLRELSIDSLKELLRQFREVRESNVKAPRDFLEYVNDVPETASLFYNVTGRRPEQLASPEQWDNYLGDRVGMIVYRIDSKEGR